MKSKRILLIILLAVVMIPYICYVAIFVSTNQVLYDVKNAFRTPDTAQNSYTEEDPIKMYNYNYSPDSVFPDTMFGLAGKVEIKAWRRFVWHNFYDGYIWAAYIHRVYDENGELTQGSGSADDPIDTKWKIHRDSIFDKWKIVDIIEAP
jgi:hypothetical protein